MIYFLYALGYIVSDVLTLWLAMLGILLVWATALALLTTTS